MLSFCFVLGDISHTVIFQVTNDLSLIYLLNFFTLEKNWDFFWPQEVSSILHFNFPEGSFYLFHSSVCLTSLAVLDICSDGPFNLPLFGWEGLFFIWLTGFRSRCSGIPTSKNPTCITRPSTSIIFGITCCGNQHSCPFPAEEPKGLQKEHALVPLFLDNRRV